MNDRLLIDLKQLADEVVGTIEISSWKNVDVLQWQREQRVDREELQSFAYHHPN